jgi:hypothetical protein
MALREGRKPGQSKSILRPEGAGYHHGNRDVRLAKAGDTVPQACQDGLGKGVPHRNSGRVIIEMQERGELVGLAGGRRPKKNHREYRKNPCRSWA